MNFEKKIKQQEDENKAKTNKSHESVAGLGR